MQVHLVFPHQLFEDVLEFSKDTHIVFVEEPLLFSQYPFHKQKLLLHRASMHLFQTKLQKAGFKTHYLTHKDSLTSFLAQQKPTNISYFDVVDTWLEQKLQKLRKEILCDFTTLPTPMFLCTQEYIESYFTKHKRFQTPFYIEQRKRFNILIEKDGTPTGDKWTFDTENRKKIPKDIPIPHTKCVRDKNVQNIIAQVSAEIEKEFGNNYGTLQDFVYPVTHTEACVLLDSFLHEKLALFGPYEDAIVKTESFLFHSALSSSLNIGLLTPRYVVDTTLAYAKKHNVPIQSLEGFLRQIIGWREYIRAMYMLIGNKERTKNFFQFTKKIPESWWEGSTTLVPVNDSIKKVLQTGYCHHIERLMILGNTLLLSEYDPDDVHRWFMTLFIDAYDWVMVPNVYGMSQFADGGMMTTKPYISGSSYILKMSNYKKESWSLVWDALYWNFISKHRTIFSKNPRSKMMVTLYDKMNAGKKEEIRALAQTYSETHKMKKVSNHNPGNMETKLCKACGRVFNNRKKWKSRNQWEHILYCSAKCRALVKV